MYPGTLVAPLHYENPVTGNAVYPNNRATAVAGEPAAPFDQVAELAALGKKLTRLQKLRLDVALLWAEGRLFDAWEKLGQDYLAELNEMPASPGRVLAEESAAEWKRQMESRMLTRAWRSMYSLSRQLEPSALQEAFAAPQKQQTASW